MGDRLRRAIELLHRITEIAEEMQDHVAYPIGSARRAERWRDATRLEAELRMLMDEIGVTIDDERADGPGEDQWLEIEREIDES